MGDKEVFDNDRSGPQPWASVTPSGAGTPPIRKGPGLLVWALLGVLGLLALAVIFVLPSVVERYELPFTPKPEVAEIAAPVTTTPGNGVSPFEEAQRARARQEAQEVLASLLEKQEALDGLAVQQWAQLRYEAAVEAARQGDEAYRTQDFAEATRHYRAADDNLTALQGQIPKVYSDAMQQARQALQSGDADTANKKFALALAVQPGDADAQAGLKRAEALSPVLGLLKEAEDLRDAGDLEGALSRVQQAIALDNAHAGAQALLAQLRTAIADKAFAAVMSEGFNALQAGDSETAITRFERALQMRPGSTQAQEAITQTRDQLAIARINSNRSNAEGFVAQEQWDEAVKAYDAALAIDANLVFAVEGRDYAGKRQQLDSLLRSAIEQPERLSDTAVYDQAVQVYYTGRNIADAGPRLLGQLDTLEGLLNRAQVPVEITLASDNITEVTLYQVGVLGRFSEQVVSLKPGKYVAVGTRPGYRDVRTEFEVGFDNRSAPVTVACTEEIVAVNRR